MSFHHRTARTVVIAALGAAALAAPAAATTPGHNGKIAFSAVVADGSAQIFTVRPDGRGLHQITHADGDSVTPDWSPDGRRLAFEFDSPTVCGMQLMRADGSDVRDLPGVPGSTCNGQPAFTADGRGVVFESFTEATNDDAIWSEDLSGAHLRRIAQNATDPNVSPDGRRMSYIAFGQAELQQALVVDDIRGGDPQQAVPFDKDVAVKQDWAPDGRRLVYTDNADNFDVAANLATVRADGTGVRYLTHFTDPQMRAYAGSYSPDGRWIVFRLEDHGLYSLAKIRTDGTHLRTILKPSSFRPRYIDWGARPDRRGHGHQRR
jgi:Tol biopolymer transport system component